MFLSPGRGCFQDRRYCATLPHTAVNKPLRLLYVSRQLVLPIPTAFRKLSTVGEPTAPDLKGCSEDRPEGPIFNSHVREGVVQEPLKTMSAEGAALVRN